MHKTKVALGGRYCLQTLSVPLFLLLLSDMNKLYMEKMLEKYLLRFRLQNKSQETDWCSTQSSIAAFEKHWQDEEIYGSSLHKSLSSKIDVSNSPVIWFARFPSTQITAGTTFCSMSCKQITKNTLSLQFCVLCIGSLCNSALTTMT